MPYISIGILDVFKFLQFSFFKNGLFRPLFLYFRLFNTVDIRFSIK